METPNSKNTNSDRITPENNYKFDNYGIVIADSIDDLLYDKYSSKINKYLNKRYDNLYGDPSKKTGYNNRFSNKKRNTYLSQNIFAFSKFKDNNENQINSTKNNNNKFNKGINSQKKDNNNNNNGNNDFIKFLDNKSLNFKSKKDNKEDNKNKPIKIILNINNRGKKEVEINPNDNDSIKNISINSNSMDKKDVKNSINKNIKKLNLADIINSNKKDMFKTANKRNIFHINIKKIISIPHSTMCHFTKAKKIISIKKRKKVLKNVVNNYYFCTKELDLNNVNRDDDNDKYDKKQKKVYVRKLKHKEKSNRNNRKEDDNFGTEIDITKSKHSQNIIIKIINPQNPSYRYSQIDIKSNSSNKLKSKSLKKIKVKNNIGNNKLLPFKMNGIKKIKKIKNINNNNRYQKAKENTEFPLLKNKEIINAINHKPKKRGNSVSCFNIKRKKKENEKISRNLGITNKNISKSEKSMKINLKPEFNINNRIKNRLLNSQQKMDRKKIKRHNKIDGIIKYNLFPQTNKIVIDKRNENLKQQDNISCSSMNKYSNFTHIEFPAIDSYFY